MPLDVFAALGALVRAEAVRTRPQPAPAHADETAPQQPGIPAPTPAEPRTGAAAPPAAPPPARKGPLSRLVRKLTALFG
ncbi:hypothetical protein [Streptomyces sp. NPDC054765]